MKLNTGQGTSRGHAFVPKHSEKMPLFDGLSIHSRMRNGECILEGVACAFERGYSIL